MKMDDSQRNAEPAIFSYFDLLPDDIILLIFEYITDYKDMCTLLRINKRLSVITGDKSLAVDFIDFREQYWLSADVCEDFIRTYAKTMDYINLDNCYWFKSIDASIFLKCTRLSSLHIMHIEIPAKTLCQILSNLSKLTSLSISISDIEDFHVQLAASPGAQECLRYVVELKLHFSKRLYHGHQPVIDFNKLQTLFQYCRDIEEIHFYGNTNNARAVTQCIIQPKETNANKLENVQVMTLNTSMDPVTRHIFFETLRLVCSLPVCLTTLVAPSFYDDQFWCEELNRDALKNGRDLVHLDASGTHLCTAFDFFGFRKVRKLNYLNVSGNLKLNSSDVWNFVFKCESLTCLNLENCTNILAETSPDEWDHRLYQPPRHYDSSGLELLILRCLWLRNLNLNGIHIHPIHMKHSQYKNMASLLSTNTQWQSLSLPSCSLHTKHPKANVNCRRCCMSNVNPVDHMTFLQRTDLGSENDFQKLIRRTPDMEHFELISTGFTSAFSKTFGVQPATSSYRPCSPSVNIHDCTLIDIYNWKNLKSLQLTAIEGIKLGYCLWALAHVCTCLEKLYIAFLGELTHCTYKDWLVTSLPFFSNLKDFRLEQPHLAVDKTLLNAIGKCSTLERICIIALRGSFSTEGVKRLFASLPNLINFQLYTGDCVKKCKYLRNFLLDQYLESRPALTVCIYPLLSPKVQEVVARDVPDQHFDEMTILKSRVAIRPIEE